MARIESGQELVYGDHYIATPDKTMRLKFKTREEREEAREFMQNVFAAGRREGANSMSFQYAAAKDILQEHIDNCESALIALKEV